MSPEVAGEQATILDLRVAAVAAAAARAETGVLRLQPGLWGLLQQLRRELWQRDGGAPCPDLAGVEAQIRDGTTTIDLTVVSDGRRSAAAVAVGVQRAVSEAVTARLGVPVASVAVHVCEISLPE